MLLLENITKRFAGNAVLDRINLRVAAGELVCLNGPSGSGKSTLLEVAAGVIRPDSGTVRREAVCALAFQDDALIPWLDAAGNMDYALAALERQTRRERTKLWLERFGLPQGKRPLEMSGGMRRRLNMARAFASGRGILILDEPFAFLDEAWQDRCAAFILEACRPVANPAMPAAPDEAHAWRAVLIASHDNTPLKKALAARTALGVAVPPCRFIDLTRTRDLSRPGGR